MSIGDEYAVFQRHKLKEYLREKLDKKQDLGWVPLVVLTVSLAYTIQGEYGRLSQPPLPAEVARLTVLGIVAIGVFAYLCYSFWQWLKFRTITTDSVLEGLGAREVDHDTTGILVVKRLMHGEPHVLVLVDPAWGYLLPYKRETGGSTAEEATGVFKGHFSELFHATHGVVAPVPELFIENAIKINPDKNRIMRFSFIFFGLSDADPAKLNAFVAKGSYAWKPLSSLLEDSRTMRSNADVIGRLSEGGQLAMFPDSIRATSQNGVLPSDLKVIWNVTDTCSFDCSFCGTRRNAGQGSELSFEQRVRVMEELLDLPNPALDFAGGDPLADLEARKFIFHAVRYMSRDAVTITTTGRAAQLLTDEEMDELFDRGVRFDVSYDFPSAWGASAHRDGEYNSRNFEWLKRLRSAGVDFTVLTTLSDQNADDDVLRAMQDELGELAPEHLTLLRLMPVGRQSFDDYPDEYSTTKASAAFRGRFANACKLQCAFRACLDGGDCNMLSEKLGVDHLGNVFACAWAGYLDFDRVEDNPFFIGSLLNDGGIEGVFKSQRMAAVKKFKQDGEGRGCRIFSYLASAAAVAEDALDPLLAGGFGKSG